MGSVGGGLEWVGGAKQKRDLIFWIFGLLWLSWRVWLLCCVVCVSNTDVNCWLKLQDEFPKIKFFCLMNFVTLVELRWHQVLLYNEFCNIS